MDKSKNKHSSVICKSTSGHNCPNDSAHGLNGHSTIPFAKASANLGNDGWPTKIAWNKLQKILVFEKNEVRMNEKLLNSWKYFIFQSNS